MLVGSQIGGRLGGIGQKRLLCAALVAYGLMLFAVLFTVPALPLAMLVLLAAGTSFGLRATANASIMSEQAVSARTTVFAFSAATVAAGNRRGRRWRRRGARRRRLRRARPLLLVSAVLSALLVAAFVRERAAEEPVAPAAAEREPYSR
jgi:hypothetical protein